MSLAPRMNRSGRRPVESPRVAQPLAASVALTAWLAAAGCGSASAEVHTTSAATARDPLDSITAEELLRRGEVLAEHGDFVRAEQYLLAARSRGVDETRVIPPLMQVCVRASRLSAAIGYAEPYLERHPGEWPLRILVASIHLGLGHLAEARAHLERALRDGRPEPAEAHYLLGIVLREQVEDAEARRHFERYLALEPRGVHAEEVAAILAEEALLVPSPAPLAERPQATPVRLPAADGSTPGAGGGP